MDKTKDKDSAKDDAKTPTSGTCENQYSPDHDADECAHCQNEADANAKS